MTHYPGPGGEQPPPYPPAQQPPRAPYDGWSPFGPAPGYPPPPPPRRGWSTTRVVLVTLGGVLLLFGLLVAVVLTFVPLPGQPADVRRDEHGRVVRADTVDKDELRTGDCVNDAALRDLAPGSDIDTIGPTVDVLPCRRPHDFEVFAAFPLPDGDYSEADSVRTVANRQCIQRLQRDWFADRALLRDKTVAYYMPQQPAPHRGNIVCMLQLVSGDQMRGTIR